MKSKDSTVEKYFGCLDKYFKKKIPNSEFERILRGKS